MPYTPHYRLTFGGTLAPDTPVIEIWSCTINLAHTGGPGPDNAATVDQAHLDDAAADVKTFIQDPRMKFSNAVHLTYVKLNRVDANNRYQDEVTWEKAITPSGTGDSGAPFHPFQCSLVASLFATGRGPTRRGRVYLPPSTQNLGAEGTIQSGDQINALAGFKSFIDNLNNWPSIDLFAPRVVVASSVDGNHNVTSVKVGRVFDTHRSRRNKLMEKYLEAGVG